MYILFSSVFFGVLLLLFPPAASGQEATRAPLAPPPSPPLHDYPVLTEKRLALLKEYMKIHYGLETTALKNPALIVVHYTAMSGLEASLKTFRAETLSSGRTDIAGHGDVNVGVHYLIAKDGTIFRLQPEETAGRHAICFNWCALGIELVGKNEKELTEKQLQVCVRLIAWMVSRLPSVEYLIGHHEYADAALPHFKLFIEKDPTYKAHKKIDPGAAFMKKLRALLAADYAVSLKD